MLLYCYIRRFKNLLNTNPSRITKEDLKIAKEIMNECNIDFENVSLDEMDKIETLLAVNIHVFGCDNNLILENYQKVKI